MRGVLAADETTVGRLVGLLKPDGALELLVSVVEGDVAADSPPLDESAVRSLADVYETRGLKLDELRLAEVEDIDRLGSSWGRRLGIPNDREGWILRFSL